MRTGKELEIRRLSNWSETGVLQLETKLASQLAEDIDRLEHWLEIDLWMRPFESTTLRGDARNMTWRSREILRAVNNFREHALPTLGREWGSTLPCIPLTRSDAVVKLKRRQQMDEHLAIRHLGDLESASAAIILN